MIWLSVPLGLLSWVIPIEFHKKKPAAVSAVSFGLCGLALLNVLWELYGRTVSGDYAALMDLTDNLVWCSVALVIGTVLLNLRLYLPKQTLHHWLARISPFWGTLILQTMYFLGVAVYAAYFGSHTTGYHLGLRSGLLGLALAVILLIVYRIKTRKQELSLQISGAILVFPVIEFLLFYLAMFLPGGTLPYEYEEFLGMVLLCYSLPALVLSVLFLNIGPMILENLRH